MATHSSGVCGPTVPLASRTQSTPFTSSALMSLPPPVAVRTGSIPARRIPASATASERDELGSW